MVEYERTGRKIRASTSLQQTGFTSSGSYLPQLWALTQEVTSHPSHAFGVSTHFTLTTHPLGVRAVSFLWHFP